MVEKNELIELILSALLFFIMLMIYRNSNKGISSYWVIGISVLMLNSVSTVVEGFVFPAFFNFIEHLCFPIAVLLFLAASIKLYKTRNI